MGKATGQMQELTQKYLDDYNTLYNWEYNEMCRFIENFSEEEFVEHYETYNRLCDDYGTELVDNFGLHFDQDASQFENFEDMYEGEYGHSTDFAEHWVTQENESTKNLPDWLEIDYAEVWENKLSKDYFEIDCAMSDHTYGHIFKNKTYLNGGEN
tara:strand:+ start:365 stop:829 length:465 start_codon:yes stop_codon:yes gene_type:complete